LPLDRDLWVYAALALVYFGSFFIKGAVGMGSLSPSILLGTLFIGPHQAILLALLTNIASQAQFVPQGLRDGDWAVTRSILVWNFAGAGLGVWIFGQVESATLTILLALTLGAISVADMTRALERLSRNRNMTGTATMATLAGLAGLVSGVAGAGGLFLVAIYLKLICPEPRRFRGTIILMSTFVVTWRFLLMLLAGHITLELAGLALLLLPFVILGGLSGSRFFGRLSTRRFFHVFHSVMMSAAAILLLKGLWAL
jgi:uncharacterized membrane protein YfcA